MTKLSLRRVVLVCVTLLSFALFAEIKLPAIISSGMVLQRDAEVTLWGWADKGEKISVNASWLDADVNTKPDADGRWEVKLQTTNSLDAQSIVVESKSSKITLDDVLFGEVWLCSGQSNMEMPVCGFNGQPSFGGQEALLNAENPMLRLFTVEKVGAKETLNDLEKYKPWQAANAENVSKFSVVAYYYGQQLQQMLGVPVGIIHTSWGGSNVRAWMSVESLMDVEGEANVNAKKPTHHTPALLYNAMVHPLISYHIKGVLWYQGESNRDEPKKYEALLPAMVNDWRNKWGVGEFPFYFVQIAPYSYGNDEFNTVKNTSFIRESLMKCNDLIPNSGMAVTTDIGEQRSIHPAKKKQVADRLLYLSLSQTYGYTAFDGESPEYKSMEAHKKGLKLTFDHAERGLFAYNGLKDFEIAGEDHVFYPAKASIINKHFVYVESDKVAKPMAVRYAWRNFVAGTLFDTNGLPASSFRTDDWEDATLAEEETVSE